MATTEEDRLKSGIPLFTDVKYKDGWTLKFLKQTDILLYTELINSAGISLEIKVFDTQKDSQIDLLSEYISLFEDPNKNYKKMMKINVTRVTR